MLGVTETSVHGPDNLPEGQKRPFDKPAKGELLSRPLGRAGLLGEALTMANGRLQTDTQPDDTTQIALDTERFMRGFVAKLLQLDESALQPRNLEDRLGFRRVLDVLEEEIAKLRRKGRPSRLYVDLVRLRNNLSPSNVGAFDNFETALRDLQLSATDCPNPFYDEIVFTVSRPNAEATLAELPEEYRLLIEKAAKAFVNEKSSVRR